jgi:hypothetical protein
MAKELSLAICMYCPPLLAVPSSLLNQALLAFCGHDRGNSGNALPDFRERAITIRHCASP